MPICAVRRLERNTNGLFDVGLRVLAVKPAPVVIERRPEKVRDLQQEEQLIVRLEIFNSSNFQRRSRDLKARNFPKYATSARSRSISVRSVSISLSGGESSRSVGGLPRRFGRSPSSLSRR